MGKLTIARDDRATIGCATITHANQQQKQMFRQSFN
jgi:hypothetical protein